MNEAQLEVPDDAGPTIEVRVCRDGDVLTTELCETREEAAEISASWEETPGIRCEIRDLSTSVQDDVEVERSADDDREVLGEETDV